MQTVITAILTLGVIITLNLQNAAAQSVHKIDAKLICGPHSANPQLKAFQQNLVFFVSQGQLQAKRILRSNGGGEDIYRGTISGAGAILVSSKGQYRDGTAFISDYTGTRNDTADTVLTGTLTMTSGSLGMRDCQLIFLKPRAPL